MKQLILSLLSGIFMLTGQAVFSQSMTNTSHTITLTNSCLTASSGTYTLNLSYYDMDYNASVYASPVTCTVTSNGAGEIIISTNDLTFPTPDTNGSWYLADGWPGSIFLYATPSSQPNVLIWFLNEDGTLGFNCTPLGIAATNALPAL